MKNSFTILFALLLLCPFGWNKVNAQSLDSLQNKELAVEQGIVLPPLSAVLDSALLNSPILKAQEILIRQKRVLTTLEKKMVMRALTLNSQYSRGNNSAFVDNQLYGVPYTTSTATNFYSGGFFLNLSLFQVAARKESIQNARMTYEIESINMDLLQRNVRIELTNIYTDCVLKAKILKMRREALSVSNINFHYAEKAFNDNEVDIQVYADVVEVNIKMKVAYEQALTEYCQSIVLLEETAGIKLETK